MFYRVGVSANPPKNDQWRPYPDIRFVLVRSVARLKPCRGLILDWRLSNRRWQAQVIYYDDAALEPAIKIAWLPASALIPVPIDPTMVVRRTHAAGGISHRGVKSHRRRGPTILAARIGPTSKQGRTSRRRRGLTRPSADPARGGISRILGLDSSPPATAPDLFGIWSES